VTIDSRAPGGQAGKSSKIENYLGFPTGISGSDLANRAYIQAQKFGCNISIPHKAESIEHTGDHFILCATNLSNCVIYKNRRPQSLETSIPGFFAVGDVRKGSVKRVASAVGEGSMAVSQVHQFLGELANRELARA